MMSRRLLVVLSLMMLVLALSYVAVQLLLPSLAAKGGGVAESHPASSFLAVADKLQGEWRRISWDIGRQPPAFESRDQRQDSLSAERP